MKTKLRIISFLSALMMTVLCFTGCSPAVAIDGNKCVNVTFSGYSGDGTASASVDSDYILSLLGDKNELTANSVASSISVEPIKNSGSLSNGDAITVKLKAKTDVLENAGVLLLNTELPFTVSGLKEKEKLDIFKNVEIKTTGISPECSVSFSYSGAVGSSYDFSVKRADGKKTTENYKNGDKLTVSLTDEAIERLKKEYIIEETSREYTVQSEKSYILSAADLSEKDVAALKKISDDYFNKKFIELSDWNRKDISIFLDDLAKLNPFILASEGNPSVKSVDNVKFDSAYIGIGKPPYVFGSYSTPKDEKLAYFFYTADLTYSFRNKETTMNDVALVIHLKKPVVDESGKISCSESVFYGRKDLDTALKEMLNDNLDKIA